MEHEDPPAPRRSLTAAGATALGTAALLVLSFGPAALALEVDTPADVDVPVVENPALPPA